MLEDDFTDVLRKALKGLALTPGEASLRAGISSAAVDRMLQGEFSSENVRLLAPVLNLNADALLLHRAYQPIVPEREEVKRLDLPFHDGGVNAWVLQKEGMSLLFDTGLNGTSLESALRSLGLSAFEAVFITHAHPDHVGGLHAVLPYARAAYGPGNVGEGDLTTIEPGDVFRIGPFEIGVIDLAGHCEGALGYHVGWGDLPVCVVGDSLFAGSIGGCSAPATYATALKNLRREVLSLPGETLLLPGHGPATTVRQEENSNPFFLKENSQPHGSLTGYHAGSTSPFAMGPECRLGTSARRRLFFHDGELAVHFHDDGANVFHVFNAI